MNKVTLLGDSIIDNKVYVESDELSVLEHLENISNDEFFIEVMVVCADVTATSLAFAVIPSPPITFNTEFVVVKPVPANNVAKSANDSFAAVPVDPPSKNNI